MPMPGSYPQSSMPMSTQEMIEAGRFTGWMASPPEAALDAGDLMEEMMSGRMDMSKNPMFLPAEFAVDDEVQFRYRDYPSQGFATQTTTTKGRGQVYTSLSGMLMCDLTKMTCDINNILFQFSQDKDAIAVTTSSDVPGFEGKTETRSPTNALPKLPQALVARLTALPLKLPLPMTVTFSEPAGDDNLPPGSAAGDVAPVVTLEVTLTTTRGPS